MKEMDYKPFIGKTITSFEEREGWIDIKCGNKASVSFRILTLDEEKGLRLLKKFAQEYAETMYGHIK